MSCPYDSFPNPSSLQSSLQSLSSSSSSSLTLADIYNNSTVAPWSNLKTVMNNLKECDGGDGSICTQTATNITNCYSQFQTSVNAFNEQIVSLENENKSLRSELLINSQNTNLSATFFRMYKQNAAIAYIQNCLVILGILYLILQITRILGKTTEFKAIKENIIPTNKPIK